ncbi:ADP-ribosylglycohydrolase family protein [Candidatus Uhrbacteria bacterium]|nr:ADP-ribosylglycohydrolase family protein [Candidatus Uhrbacteria bacterium]
MVIHKEDRAIGCMIGGAYGDCLGAAVEFMSLDQIRRIYGPRGIIVPQPAYGFSHPVITDDTQMAMATAEGILSTPVDERRNAESILWSVWSAYRRWYATQCNPAASRAPGSTCMSALGGRILGSVKHPLNQSAGCGGIMRAHPAGVARWGHPIHAFALGVDTAALTHGHSNGYVPSGVLAALVASLIAGASYDDALAFVQECMHAESPRLGHDALQGTQDALWQAGNAPVDGDHEETIDRSVGRSVPGKEGGWLGHDALAIALYAVRCAPDDPIEAVRIAVNHSGDSDSTGSIVGAIMGARFGPAPFEHALTAHAIALEHHDDLVTLGQRLVAFDEEGT